MITNLYTPLTMILKCPRRRLLESQENTARLLSRLGTEQGVYHGVAEALPTQKRSAQGDGTDHWGFAGGVDNDHSSNYSSLLFSIISYSQLFLGVEFASIPNIIFSNSVSIVRRLPTTSPPRTLRRLV